MFLTDDQMLTNTLPSSTERITQLEHQVKDHVQSEIDRLESRLNKYGEWLDRRWQIEV